MAVLSYALLFERALKYLQIFLNGLLLSLGDAAYASIPFVGKINRLCLHGKRAEPSWCRPVRHHRLQPAIDFRFVAPVERISPSEMPRPAQNLPVRGQRGEASLFLVSADTRCNLQLSQILFVYVLCQRLVQMGFSKTSQMPSHASLCEHCSLSPSSAKEAMPVWREVFNPSFNDRFPDHFRKKDLSTKGIERE